MPSDIAFLAYYPFSNRDKKSNNSFEGNQNIGAHVIMDVLRRRGVPCDICTPDTAHNYKIVLVSITSDFDPIALYRAISLLPSWQPGKRKFTVVAGGAGLQNPTVIRRYIDYGVFGRAEEIVYPLVDAILGGGTYEHESVMHLPDISPVTIAQAKELYPHTITLGGGTGEWTWKEPSIGCNHKCLFCHYSWSRKHIGQGAYFRPGETSPGKYAVQVLWNDIFNITKKPSWVRTAIDGFSERLRTVYGKGFITNQMIIDAIHCVGSRFDGRTVIKAYNISNMPHETQEDRDEFYNTAKLIETERDVLFIFHSTPFRSSLITPLQWSPVALFPAISDVAGRLIHRSKNKKLLMVHSYGMESPWAQLLTMIVSRATPQTDTLFHTVCFHPKLKHRSSREKIAMLKKGFDLSPYIREYDPDEEHPVWFLSSYTGKEVLKRMYRVSEQKMSKDGGG